MKRSSHRRLGTLFLLWGTIGLHGQTDLGETNTPPPVINPDVIFSPEDTIWLTDPTFSSEDTIWLTPDEVPVIAAGTEVIRTVTILLKQPLDYVIQPPPINVAVGSKLRVELDQRFAEATEIEWMQNGQPVGTGETAFEIEMIPVAFNSSFQARFRLNDREEVSHGVTVVATAFEQQPITNISTRSTIGPNNPRVIVGLTIPPARASGWLPKLMLVRAVGQTLADYGVANPLPDPTLRIYNAYGQDVTPYRSYPAIIYEDGTTPESRHYETVAAAAQRAGAFPIPLPGPESPPISEYADLVSLYPGIYTIVVSSEGGLSGDVLVEVYETN